VWRSTFGGYNHARSVDKAVEVGSRTRAARIRSEIPTEADRSSNATPRGCRLYSCNPRLVTCHGTLGVRPAKVSEPGIRKAIEVISGLADAFLFHPYT
jgi:hypothetical protein